jgi:hypothetical protein
MKIDHKKFADKAFESLSGASKKKGAAAEADDKDGDEAKPGHHGRLAIAAHKAGDGVAFEEAIRAIHGK